MGYLEHQAAYTPLGDCTHVRAEDCYEPGAHLKVRRRTPEEREVIRP